MPVYFIRAGSTGPIKIGHARNPQSRLSEIQVGHHEEVRLLGWYDGGVAEERALHARFSQHHIRGEWFHPADEILEMAEAAPGKVVDPPFTIRQQYEGTALGRYLNRHGLTLEEFRWKTGVTAATISRIARGLYRPDWSTLEAIRAATDGKVTANDFHGAERGAGRAA